MSILFLLIPLSIIVAITFLLIFIRACKSGQFSDMQTPAMRILQDVTIKNKTK
ncbi:cbb3-type cytochrome oxidase assembly protein CcoS [Myroides marinus]|uniref:cbb3-type cytochrome oxidase assembly protein CcoS n=1 Tax=Myroides marinus TaxID=703342 RepID=UPI000942A194|nr:cbb3-type cytochrome oxidase assembly protein CcoS [Myroides marinus]